MVKYKDQNIIYTLTYGGYATKKQKIVVLVVPNIFVILGTIIFILMLIYKEHNAWLGLIISLIGIIALIHIIYALNKETKQDKEICIWINDEDLIKTTAKSWQYGSNYSTFITSYKFGIEFNVNGNVIKKVSLNFDGFYKSIKNKEIEILYSPKYDEVMILD